MSKKVGAPSKPKDKLHGACISLHVTEEEKDLITRAAATVRRGAGPWAATIAIDAARRILGTG